MAGSIVQIVGPGGASSADTSIVSSSITCTAGNQLWVIAISDDTTISSISDSFGGGANTYTERGSVIEAAVPRRLHHATCTIATGGTGTVTVNLGASVANRQVWLVEIAGVSAYDAQGTATDTGNNPTTAASATNTAQPAFCIAACVDYQGGTPTVGQISGSGATSGGTLAAGGQLAGLVEYRSVTTVTSQTANFGNAGFNRTCTVFAVFLESAPPAITVQPTDQTANDGATATFTVTETGATSYQWKKNGSNVGTSSNSYALTATFADQSAQITVDCINASGTTTSSAATLRVAFELSGTGPRSVSLLGGGPMGAGSVESYLRGAAAAGGTHTTTGALAADAATIAGTAVHSVLHATSGALTSQDAAIAGTAAHLLLHTSTGALSAQAAAIAGSAAHQHATSGALSAQAAAVAGTAAHATLHTSTGALSAQSAAIAGTAAHQHATSGALTAQAATIAGTAAHQHVATGALAAQAAAIAGTADHRTLHTSTGALAADAASISGAAAHEHATSGALLAQAATLDGAAEHSAAGTHDATGALAAQDATMSGVAEHIDTGDGLLDPKLIAKKRRQNQNITFKGAGGQAPRKKRDQAPEPVKAKVSPLLLGLMARGLAMPTPAAPVALEIAPALDVASIAQALLATAIEVPKPEVPLTLEQQLAARVEQLERENAQLQAELTALRTPPEPVQATPRDPIHEALHAILPALADPIDLDAVPDEPEEEPPAAAPQVEQPPRMTPQQIEVENKRRALLLTALLT